MVMLSATVEVTQLKLQFRDARLFQPAGLEPLGSTLLFYSDSIRHNLVDSSVINSDTSRTLSEVFGKCVAIRKNNIVISHRTIH